MGLERKEIVDGQYQFDCTSCGECCRGDIEIRLNLNDLQKMVRHLGLQNAGELFDEDLIDLVPQEGGGYRVTIQFRENLIKFCPFLENRLENDGELKGFCQLHPYQKPLVCKMAPVGREIEFPDMERWFFSEPIEGCPGCRSAKSCDLKSDLENWKDELEAERQYYQVLVLMLNNGMSSEDYLIFHSGIQFDHDIEEYLSECYLKMRSSCDA
ncbi:MAG: YkgJ family cysteine cluster protein [Opitutales bacterium]|nr:YkgJ family cysteine cluster protein [Opitutales bacterium]